MHSNDFDANPIFSALHNNNRLFQPVDIGHCACSMRTCFSDATKAKSQQSHSANGALLTVVCGPKFAYRIDV